MGALHEQVCLAIEREAYLFSLHADERVRERGFTAWQVVGLSLDGELDLERPNNEPDPVVEIRFVLPDGSLAKSVWAWLEDVEVAKLVTVHFLE